MGNKQKVIKQHYVPRCYLERWKMPGKESTNVYDKITKNKRINNVYDVASERYFYDLNYSKVLNDEELSLLGISKEELQAMEDEQLIETFFGTKIEGNFSKILSNICSRIGEMPSEKDFMAGVIEESEKKEFSMYLAFQFLRTKSIRNDIMDMADCLAQALKEMGIPQKDIDEYCDISKDDVKMIHNEMLLDEEQIIKTATRFSDLVWIFIVNDTDQPFYTSDNPVGTIAHAEDAYLSGKGLMCYGVEVVFPVSPNILLAMYDGSFHVKKQKFDKAAVKIRNAVKLLKLKM